MIPVLPITTSAASPMPKVTMNDPNNKIDCNVGANATYKTWYAAFEEVYGQDNTLIGTYPYQTLTKPADNYIEYHYDSAKAILYVTFNNVNYIRTGAADNFIRIANNNASYSNAFDIVFTFNGNNTIRGTRPTLYINNSKSVTFTGTGSLTMDGHFSSNGIITLPSNTDFTISNMSLTIYNSYGSGEGETGTIAGIMSYGSVIIDNATININAGRKSSSIRTATKVSSNLTSPTYGITIKHNSHVTLTSNSITPLQTDGPIVFDNSTIYISKGTGNKSPVFNRAPEIIGNYSSKKGGYGELDRMYPGSFGLQPGDLVSTDHRLTNFELVHKHAPTDCTKESLCACTKATVPATAESHTIEQMEASIVTCTQDGWEAYEFCVNCEYSTKVLTQCFLCS